MNPNSVSEILQGLASEARKLEDAYVRERARADALQAEVEGLVRKLRVAEENGARQAIKYRQSVDSFIASAHAKMDAERKRLQMEMQRVVTSVRESAREEERQRLIANVFPAISPSG